MQRENNVDFQCHLLFIAYHVILSHFPLPCIIIHNYRTRKSLKCHNAAESNLFSQKTKQNKTDKLNHWLSSLSDVTNDPLVVYPLLKTNFSSSKWLQTNIKLTKLLGCPSKNIGKYQSHNAILLCKSTS